MAFLPQFLLAFFIFFSLLQILNSSKEMTVSIHDLLMSKGLPPGLIPKDVKSYTFSENGLLEVFLEAPCLTKFDTMALYESTVKANLTYGGLTDVEGFSQEELFLWLPVKDIIVSDPTTGIILFDIGLAQKQLSLSLFEDPPDCKQDDGVHLENIAKRGGERRFEAKMQKKIRLVSSRFD